MIGINRRRLLVASTVLATSGLVISTVPAQAFSPRTEVGVTATSIKLGVTIPMTGAASPGYNKIPSAMKAYFDYVNANGGINGRKITLIVKDDQYVPTLAVAKTNELILKDKVFALLGPLGTANIKAVAASVNPARRGIPVLFVNTGYSGFAVKKTYPTTFSLFPSYIMEAKIMAQYIKETFPDKKIGLLYQDDDFGVDALAGFKQAGLTFTVKVPYASGSQGVSGVPATWIQKLSAAGAEVVVLFGITSATGAALGTAAVMKYAPKWILGSVGGDATTIKALGVPVGVLYGAMGASYLPAPTDTTDDYIKLFQEINTKYNDNAVFDNNVLVGMNGAFVAVQAIAAAGAKPTRKGLIAAIEKKGATFFSAGIAPLNYSATNHSGYSGFWFGTYSPTGEMKPNGGVYSVYTTDSGTGAVVKSTYKRPAMPANGLPIK
ncbi:MAG: ABC transporter substrate-binding protein [Candidatus Nanopelagicaceae bacterium]